MATFGTTRMQKKGSSKSSLNQLDLQSIQGITAFARSQGFKDEDILPKEPKLSFLQRLGRGLSAFEPANAFYEAKYEGKNFALEYIKDIFSEGASAITGKEKRAQGDVKKTFKDVLVKEGMKDREGKLDWADVVGFAGDVVTDPTTWFGGAMVKGTGKVLGGGVKGLTEVGMKVAPTKTKAIVEAFDLAKDALGKAFVPAYKTSKVSKKSGLTILDDIIEEGAETAVEKTTALEKTMISAFEEGMEKDDFVKSFLPKNIPEEEIVVKAQKLSSVYDELAESSLRTKDILAKESIEALQRKSVEELEQEKIKLIDAFRKESGLMADTAGAGTRIRKVEDAAGNLKRMVTDFSLPAAKASMRNQKEQFVKYAEEILKESDPYFKQLDEILEAKRAIQPAGVAKETPLPDFGAPIGKEMVEETVKPAEQIAKTSLEKEIEEMASEKVGESIAKRKELLPQNPILKEFVREEVAKILKGDTNTVARGLGKYVDKALEYENAEDFAKAVSADDLFGENPIDFYNRVVDKTAFAEKVRIYENVVKDMQTMVGKTYGKLFKELPNNIKEDLVDGLIIIRKKFGNMREALIKKGFDQEEVTKALVSFLDKQDAKTLFKEAETVSFFVKSLMPELLSLKKFTSKISGIGEDMLMDIYFPFIKTKTIKDFNTAQAKMSKMGYTKYFKGILEKDEIITDPAEAYATRASQVYKDGLTKNFLGEIIQQNGKPLTAFKNTDDALKNGYRLIKDKGMFGKDIGYLKLADAKYINEIFDPSFEVINKLAKNTGYDWTLNLFKKSVTGLFVPFHARNYVSGLLQNFEAIGIQSIRPDNIVKGQALAWKILNGTDDALEKMLKGADEDAIKALTRPAKEASALKEIGDYKTEDVIDAFRRKFGMSSQYISDYGMESLAKVTKESNKYMPFEMARNVGNYIETQQKATAVVTALNKGYDLEDALRLAEKAGFDYSMLTPFEKNVMRRFIPFYSFARKNIELQMNVLAKNPERLGYLTKVFRSAGSPQGVSDEEIYMPDWMRGRFSVRAGESKSGLPQMFSGFGTPIEAVGDIFDDGVLGALTMLNPTLKVPIERATGKDFFRKTDLKDVYTAKEYSHAPQFIKDWLKLKTVEKPVFIGGEPTGEKRNTYVADPMRLHIARNLFTSRGISYLDTLFGEEELSDTAKHLKSLTGVRPYEVDEEATKYFEDRDNMRDLIDYLKRYGAIKTFERAYVPKEDTGKLKKKK